MIGLGSDNNHLQGDYKKFGELMVESHNSLRDDFEVVSISKLSFSSVAPSMMCIN